MVRWNLTKLSLGFDFNIVYFIAFSISDSKRKLALPDLVSREALVMLKEHSEITFLATIKQDIGDSGSIIAFSSDVMR